MGFFYQIIFPRVYRKILLRLPVFIPIIVFSFAFMATVTITSSAQAEDSIHVKFKDGTDVDPPVDALETSLRSSTGSIHKLFTLSATQLNELRVQDSLPDLNLWFQIDLIAGTDAVVFLNQLKVQSNVEVAQIIPLPAPPAADTPDFTANQGYVGLATDGLDAEYSWTLSGGDGSGITIYDVEYNWLQSHEDLSKASGVSLLVDAGDSISPPGYPGCDAPCDRINREHGTAVLGELIADDDAIGVTGISHGADIELAPSVTTNLGYNPANAILLAVADAEPGDVILLEQQMGVCGGLGLGPIEESQPVFDAIQTAVANRITVVEAAGNGGVDLDHADCGTTFDRTDRDSGAIMVGAGEPPGASDRERRGISSYGDRVDVQGWGTGIVTTGYGTAAPNGYRDPDDDADPNTWYRFTFGGTSGASAMVAGAVANLQGIAINTFGTPLLPFQIRSLLAETGSPQMGDTSENIGPRPDLRAAIGQLTAGDVDLFFLVDLSQSFADDLPVFQAQAPGIIDSIKAANPNVRFGLARFEDYPIPPFGSAAHGDVAYERLIDLTFVTEAVKTLIAGLTTRSGADEPQCQLTALYQAASGAGQDLGPGYPGASIPANQQANFRDGATKLFLMWTDASFHQPDDPGDIPYPGPTFVETVAAIEALDPPMVLGISVEPHAGLDDLKNMAFATGAIAPEGGVDCDGDGVVDILEGQPLVCLISEFGAGIGATIVNIVSAAVEAARPVAQCSNVTVSTDPGVCTAVASIDDGSFDPDGEEVTLAQIPPPPYPLGETVVTLRVSDPTELVDTCFATVTVEDNEPPTPICNATDIIPPNAPVSFIASAMDNCSVAGVEIDEFDCFKFTKKGERVDKTESCVVSYNGDTITIQDTGGVGTHISWEVTATDGSGNTAEQHCEIIVQNPGLTSP